MAWQLLLALLLVAVCVNASVEDVLSPEDLPWLLHHASTTLQYVQNQLANNHAATLNFNTAIGLFLFKVNIESALDWSKQWGAWGPRGPGSHPDRGEEEELIRLATTSEELKDMLLHLQWHSKSARIIISSTVWMQRMPIFKSSIITNDTGEMAPAVWRNGGSAYYLSLIPQYENPRCEPDPQDSDDCLVELAHLSVDSEPDAYMDAVCPVSVRCLQLAFNGTEFGYFASHRVFMMMIGEFGKGCRSWAGRRTLHESGVRGRRLCGALLQEATLLYELGLPEYTVDLFFEFIALCSMYGDPAWVRRSWMLVAPRMQLSEGCYGIHMSQCSTYKLNKCRNDSFSQDTFPSWGEKLSCNNHMTSLVLASIGSAIRFIIETYYVDKQLLDNFTNS